MTRPSDGGPFDLSTGLELELLLPASMGRLDLAADLANWADARLEIFAFPSKVPVPELPGEYSPEALADLTVGIIESVAAHHGAIVQSVAEDGKYFYLLHRAARLLDAAGRVVLSVVHDNTIAGGERVAELVTAPFSREQSSWVRALVARVAEVEGVVVPPGGALHVHLDGRPFLTAGACARLIAAYELLEAPLRVLLATPRDARAAGPLPEGLAAAMSEVPPASSAGEVIARFVHDRTHGLNLYNLLGEDPEKLTVELKIAGATLDPERVIATRELFVALAELSLR